MVSISTSSPWNLGHSVLGENFACDENSTVDFLEQNLFGGSMWNLGHSFLAENFAFDEKKKTAIEFLEQFPQAFHGILGTLLWLKT